MANGFSTRVLRETFSPAARVQRLFDVESAVAMAQGELGVIPSQAAREIVSRLSTLTLDESALAEDYLRIGFPIVPLLNQIKQSLDEESKQWVHHGLTTQDVVDTGLMLQLKAGIELLEKDLVAIILAAGKLARDNRDAVMAGRTFQQFASPTTFGYKSAVWVDELSRHWERLQELKPRVLVGQLFGSVGTNAAGGQMAMVVQQHALQNLGLGVAETSWHSSRDRFAEVVGWLALTCSTLGKIAIEVSTLMRTEVAELREALPAGAGASSAMPQKANPVLSPRIIALSKKTQQLTASAYDAMMQEHERGVSAMPLEWLTIPEAFLNSSACFSQSRELLENLIVDEAQMARNLERDQGVIFAEAAFSELAIRLGKKEAKSLVGSALERCRENQVPFLDELSTLVKPDERIDSALIDNLCDPRNFLGFAGAMVDKQVEKVNRLFRMGS